MYFGRMSRMQPGRPIYNLRRGRISTDTSSWLRHRMLASRKGRPKKKLIDNIREDCFSWRWQSTLKYLLKIETIGGILYAAWAVGRPAREVCLNLNLQTSTANYPPLCVIGRTSKTDLNFLRLYIIELRAILRPRFA